MISLGIGDPDTPTPPHVVEAMAARGARPEHPPVPVEPRPAGVPRGGRVVLPQRRFGVELDPETQVMPAIGGKECIYNLNFAFLDAGDVALASRPRLSGLHRRARCSPAPSRC